ncbi:TBPIP-domain-containing protein [Cystobasidium minutum MCA 4210]|uniref:TBPIP-domain-containing protein n=1 Tax=Cystobasidium minutum MCA 4210 TaxID=1397322 RepID=UPI0034CE26D3|eukprot:jgi/Rhomi1/51369/CE51368_93
MPPKKAAGDAAAKGAAAKAGDPEEILLDYLIKQNRPYNATDLQANLKSKHNISKPAVVKALAALAQRGELVEKAYGKQIIYAPKQAEESTSGEDMEKIRADLTDKKARLKELNDAQRELAGQMTLLESAPTTQELPNKIAKLKADVDSQAAHLASLKSNPDMLLSKTDIQVIDASFASVKKIWMARRKAGLNSLALIADARSIGKAEQKEFFEEELGIEFDPPELEDLLKPATTSSVLGKRKAA